MKSLLPLLPLTALLLASSAQAQAIYKCVGADGQTSFSGSPCTTAQTPMSVSIKGKVIDVSTAPRIARQARGSQALALGGAKPVEPPSRP